MLSPLLFLAYINDLLEEGAYCTAIEGGEGCHSDRLLQTSKPNVMHRKVVREGVGQ